KTLVFFPHVYYLTVPFICGDPAGNWGIDPEKLHSPEAWLAFFRREHIRWVVRSPEYPDAISAPMHRLQASGKLLPFAEGQTTDFVGKRMDGVKRPASIVILRVQDGL